MRETDDQQEKRAIHTTFNGKEIEIVRVANTALFKFAFVKGGALPKELEGMYTSPMKAKDALTAYNQINAPKAEPKVEVKQETKTKAAS